MTLHEYNRLKDDATRRAHLLRQQALDAFWAALARHLAVLMKREG